MSNKDIKVKYIDDYIESLDLVGESDEGRRKALKKLLKISLDCRNNEINRYWNRSSYFWVCISALFFAYFSVISFNFENLKNLNFDIKYIKIATLIIISHIGIVFTFCALAVIKSSKFWQENWEIHVEFLTKRLYGNIFGIKMGTSEVFSISRANYLLYYSMLCIWFLLTLFPILIYFDNQPYTIVAVIFSAIIYLIIFLIIIYFYIRKKQTCCLKKGTSIHLAK